VGVTRFNVEVFKSKAKLHFTHPFFRLVGAAAGLGLRGRFLGGVSSVSDSLVERFVAGLAGFLLTRCASPLISNSYCCFGSGLIKQGLSSTKMELSGG